MAGAVSLIVDNLCVHKMNILLDKQMWKVLQEKRTLQEAIDAVLGRRHEVEISH